MKKIVCLFAVVAAFGLVSLAAATPPAPEAHEPPAEAPAPTPAPAPAPAPAAAPEADEPRAEATAPAPAIPALADPFEDLLKVEAWSCNPRCSTIRGNPCTPGTHAHCYHICGEPEICSCPNGTWTCP